MPAQALNHYNIRAPAGLLPALRDFYREFVGLVEGPRPPLNSVGYWLYAGSQAVLHLSTARDDACRQTEVTTLDHVAFTCTDFAAMRARLDAQGVAYSLRESAEQQQIFLVDPAGNGLELTSQRPCARPEQGAR